MKYRIQAVAAGHKSAEAARDTIDEKSECEGPELGHEELAKLNDQANWFEDKE